MSLVSDEYRAKLRTPEEAVRAVKSGDWVDYTSNVCFPVLLDRALARRRDELTDVKVRGNLIFQKIQVVECDPKREHFLYNSWHFSAYERKLCDNGLCNFIPMVFRNVGWYYTKFLTVNVAMMAVTPMDRHGYFNLSCATGVARAILKKADIVILEVNENLPRIYGGFDEYIHISEVDYVVEGMHPPLPQFPIAEPTQEDKAIAQWIVPHIESGATLQLGIGSMPNVVGAMLAESDVKDLSMHTELCGDAYYRLFEAGKLTNRYSAHRGKGVTGMVFGSQSLYDWVDQNPTVVVEPLSYVNDPAVIAQNEKMISINSCVSVDLFGQISSESAGLRQISGTGGQLDFLTGATMSPGGKAFICMTSSFVDKNGVRKSRIVPQFNGGEIITSPRSQAFYLVTEYGCVNLAGCTVWERAEKLISIAHPDFREELIAAAKSQKIWLNR